MCMFQKTLITFSLVLIIFVQLIQSVDLILRTRQISNTCYRDEDCPDTAKCVRLDIGMKLCQCQSGFLIESIAGHLQCLKIAINLFDPCVIDSQCQYTLSTDAQCNHHGICQCRENTHFVSKARKCYTTVKLNETCRFTHDCIAEDTSCIHGKCICPLNMHPNKEFTACIKDAKLGEACDVDEECISEKSICHGTTCQCPISYVINPEDGDCLKSAFNLSDPCLANEQCSHIIGSACQIENFNNTGSCACKNGYHWSGSRCWLSIGLNGECESDENCNFIEHSKCINNRCSCKSKFLPVDDYCSSSTKHNFNYIINLVKIVSFIIFLKCAVVDLILNM